MGKTSCNQAIILYLFLFLRFLHIPFSEVPILREIFEKRTPGPGNANTINCGVPKYKARSFENYHGPNFRIV